MRSEEAATPRVVQAHCNACGKETRSFVHAEHTKHGTDQNKVVDWWDTYLVLECCGCGDVIFKREHRFSEDTDVEEDPETGNWHYVPRVKASYFPAARSRHLPRWFDELENVDALLTEVLTEVYTALEADSLILATAGARILLDCAMVKLLGADAGGFEQKLEAMARQGIVGAEDRELLSVMTDAGSAASHRGYRPTRDHLETILDTIENLLHRKFVLQQAAAGVKAATPPRKRSG